MIAELVVSGLIVGSIYGLIALGFVLIYKSTSIINFAQGELVMAGAYFALLFWVQLKWPLPVAFAATMLASAALGAIVELVLRPLVNAPRWNVIMATFGLTFILKNLVRIEWGSSIYPFPSYFSTAPMQILGVVVSRERVAIAVFAACVMVALYVFFKFTKTGIALLATSQNRRAAQLAGVRVYRAFSLSWAMSGALGGTCGVLLAPIIPVGPDMGAVALKGFTATVIGGFLSFPGAIVGGLIVGVAESLTSGLVAPGLEEALALLMLIVVLLVKPTGLFAVRTGQRV